MAGWQVQVQVLALALPSLEVLRAAPCGRSTVVALAGTTQGVACLDSKGIVRSLKGKDSVPLHHFTDHPYCAVILELVRSVAGPATYPVGHMPLLHQVGKWYCEEAARGVEVGTSEECGVGTRRGVRVSAVRSGHHGLCGSAMRGVGLLSC